MAKHDYLLEAAWSSSPSLTRSYITCLDFYSHAVSFTVICWHDLDIFKPAKLFIQKSFWNALNARITSQTRIKKTISVPMYHQGYIWPQKGVGTCKSSVQWRFTPCVWFGVCFGELRGNCVFWLHNLIKLWIKVIILDARWWCEMYFYLSIYILKLKKNVIWTLAIFFLGFFAFLVNENVVHQMIISSSGIYLLGFSLSLTASSAHNAVFCFFRYVVLVQKLK